MRRWPAVVFYGGEEVPAESQVAQKLHERAFDFPPFCHKKKVVPHVSRILMTAQAVLLQALRQRCTGEIFSHLPRFVI